LVRDLKEKRDCHALFGCLQWQKEVIFIVTFFAILYFPAHSFFPTVSEIGDIIVSTCNSYSTGRFWVL